MRRAVEGVGDQGAPDAREVAADLVRPPGRRPRVL